MNRTSANLVVVVAIIVGLSGLALLFMSLLFKIMRTGSLWNWQLSKHADSPDESRLGFVGVALLLLAFALASVMFLFR